jgi:hypothetical protein
MNIRDFFLRQQAEQQDTAPTEPDKYLGSGAVNSRTVAIVEGWVVSGLSLHDYAQAHRSLDGWRNLSYSVRSYHRRVRPLFGPEFMSEKGKHYLAHNKTYADVIAMYGLPNAPHQAKPTIEEVNERGLSEALSLVGQLTRENALLAQENESMLVALRDVKEYAEAVLKEVADARE